MRVMTNLEAYVCDEGADVPSMAQLYLGVRSGDDSQSVVIVISPERWNSTDYGETE